MAMQSQDSCSLEKEYFPFIDSAKAVFSTMLGVELVLGEIEEGQSIEAQHDLSGIIGLSGTVQGTIVVSINEEIGVSAAEVFLGERPTSINADVKDMVAELANMVGGGAKERFDIEGISLGLPTTVTGKNHSITFDPGVVVRIIPFESTWGPLTIQVALKK